MVRPTIWTDEAIAAEAEALELWSRKDTSDHLIGFCDNRNYDPGYISDFCEKSELFLLALKRAKTKIASRLHKKVNEGTFNYGIYMRVIGMYDKFIHNHERAEKQFDSDLRKKENDNQQQQKVVFEVNYNDTNNKVEVLPQAIPNSHTSSPQ